MMAVEVNREDFEEAIVKIGRVTKVAKGGRRFRFTALWPTKYQCPSTHCAALRHETTQFCTHTASRDYTYTHTTLWCQP